MLEAHKHLNISGDHFDVVGQIVFETLDELGCPAAERDEFLELLASYRDEVVSDA